jgi:esterase/lipase
MDMKSFFYKTFSKKPVIVFVHGFSVRTARPMRSAIDYFNKHGYMTLVPTLFDPEDPQDDHPNLWIRRAKTAVETALSIKDDVVVVGFSMGGVIASEIASQYPISKLFLLAPAFEYVTFKMVRESLTRMIVKQPESNIKRLPENFYDTFQQVVALGKDAVTNITCDTVIFHGLKDELIPTRSSQYVYDHIQSKHKKFILFEDVGHDLLENKNHKDDVIQLMHHNIQIKNTISK